MKSYIRYINNQPVNWGNLHPEKYEISGYLTVELLNVVTNAPAAEHKEVYIHRFLDEYFKDTDLTKSFYKKLLIVYEEALTVEILQCLHRWFIRRCCNIENINLVVIYQIGVEHWYQKYLDLSGEPGFRIIEVPWAETQATTNHQLCVPKLDKNLINKKIKYYFCCYGGTYPSLERDVIIAALSKLDCSHNDYCGFGSTDFEFDSYLEQLTYFRNRNLVDELIDKKNTIVFNQISDRYSTFKNYFSGHQWEVNKVTAIQVIRETINDSPFTTVTEKTIKAILNLQFLMPFSGVSAIDNLENLGFRFPREIIDYSYQYEKGFLNRLLCLIDQIESIQKKYTLKQMEEQLLDNSDMLYYNYELIQSGALMNQSTNKIITNLLND